MATFATLDEAWGKPLLSPRASPSQSPSQSQTPKPVWDVQTPAKPTGTGYGSPPKARKHRPIKRTKREGFSSFGPAPSPVEDERVRAYVMRTYATRGVGGVLNLLTKPIIDDIRSSCSFFRSPEKMLIAVACLFAFLVMFMRIGSRSIAGSMVASATPGPSIPW